MKSIFIDPRNQPRVKPPAVILTISAVVSIIGSLCAGAAIIYFIDQCFGYLNR